MIDFIFNIHIYMTLFSVYVHQKIDKNINSCLLLQMDKNKLICLYISGLNMLIFFYESHELYPRGNID